MTNQDLRRIRTAMGMTQVELAEIVGVNPMTVSKWERGVLGISKLGATAIMAAYNASVGPKKGGQENSHASAPGESTPTISTWKYVKTPRAKTPRTPGAIARAARNEEIGRLAEQGKGTTALGKMFNLTPGRVDQIIQTVKHDARMACNQAVASGELVRPASCSACGSGGRIEAHHHDYSKPLDVEWLCVPCHAKEKIGRPRRTNAKQVSDDALLVELRRVAGALGHTPTCAEALAHLRYVFSTYTRRFGSWTAAVERAGLPLHPRSRAARGIAPRNFKRPP